MSINRISIIRIKKVGSQSIGLVIRQVTSYAMVKSEEVITVLLLPIPSKEKFGYIPLNKSYFR